MQAITTRAHPAAPSITSTALTCCKSTVPGGRNEKDGAPRIHLPPIEWLRCRPRYIPSGASVLAAE
jgi:hypothetical protein